jgi:hypothetical protein
MNDVKASDIPQLLSGLAHMTFGFDSRETKLGQAHDVLENYTLVRSSSIDILSAQEIELAHEAVANCSWQHVSGLW